MEPLVEVANANEMTRAVAAGAKVIGINNRDLHTFNVNMSTTSDLITGNNFPKDIFFASLSGISSRKDVVFYEQAGAKAVLVGEALMVAANPTNKVKELLGEHVSFVKICGIKDVETAIATAEAGADFIGLVFANSRRQVSIEKAQEIVAALRKWRKKEDVDLRIENIPKTEDVISWFNNAAEKVTETVNSARPLIVGVFANNDIEMMNKIAREVPLDIVQLSGKEGWTIGDEISKPSWRCVHVGKEDATHIISGFVPGRFVNILLDTSDPTAMGGTGVTFDWGIAKEIQKSVQVILAGGLDPENVRHAVEEVRPFMVDVSSGVETNGTKDIDKIQRFIVNAKY